MIKLPGRGTRTAGYIAPHRKPITKDEKQLKQVCDFLDESRNKSIASQKCIGCLNTATTFKDELAVKEYSLSGLCQNCQDAIYSSQERYPRPLR